MLQHLILAQNISIHFLFKIVPHCGFQNRQDIDTQSVQTPPRSSTDTEAIILVLHHAINFKFLQHISGQKTPCLGTRLFTLPSSQFEANAGASDRNSCSQASIYCIASFHIGRAVKISTKMIVVDAHTDILQKLLTVLMGRPSPIYTAMMPPRASPYRELSITGMAVSRFN